MRHRTLLLSTLALGLAALALVVLEPESGPPPAAEAPLVPAALLADLRSVEITSGGRTARVERTEGGWVVPGKLGLPADVDNRLRPLLQSLRQAKSLGTLTADPRRIGRLGLGDNSVVLTGADGKPWKLELGRMTDDGAGAAARLPGETAALRTSFGGHLEGEPANWIDPVLVTFAADQVLRLELAFADGTKLSLTRPKAGEPLAGAAPAALEAAEELLLSLSTLRAADAVAPGDAAAAAALAKPLAVTLALADGATIGATFGRAPSKEGEPPAAWMRASHSDPKHPVNAKSAKALFACPPWLAEQLPATAADLGKRPEAPAAPQGLPTLELEPAR
jgi:hypothetical protein